MSDVYDDGKRILDVGCGRKKIEGSVGIDMVELPGVDIVHDLNVFPWPFKDGIFDEIYMFDSIEHLNDTTKVMEESHRLLKVGGKLYIRTCYWNHKHAFSDPTHVTYFTEVTWDFFTGKRNRHYTTALFRMEKMEYTYDYGLKMVLRSDWLLNKLSKWLCNVKTGMRVTLIKR